MEAAWPYAARDFPRPAQRVQSERGVVVHGRDAYANAGPGPCSARHSDLQRKQRAAGEVPVSMRTAGILAGTRPARGAVVDQAELSLVGGFGFPRYRYAGVVGNTTSLGIMWVAAAPTAGFSFFTG